MSQQPTTEQPRGGTVVVGVDGSPASRAALAWAARDVAANGGALRAVTAWEISPGGYAYLTPYPVMAWPSRTFEREADDVLHQTIRDVLGPKPPVAVQAVVREGRPGKVLVEQAAGADLLVVGNREHRALTGMVIGSVSEYCIIHARCPVVVVHAGAESASAASTTGPPALT